MYTRSVILLLNVILHQTQVSFQDDTVLGFTSWNFQVKFINRFLKLISAYMYVT
jgi:hypothetical protein